MSWFRFTVPSSGGNSNRGLWERIFSQPRARSRKRGFDERNCRSLRIDALETRCLLSVTPATLSALVVNETFGQTTATAASIPQNDPHTVASDNSGDFVVTWTREDPVLNADGSQAINPQTGSPYEVSDVYARYFTPTVEQITLPAGTTSYTLKDNDQTIEQISITAATPPNGIATDINQGTFELSFDGAVRQFEYSEDATYGANGVETDGPAVTAQAIQSWLNGLTPVVNSSNVVVADGTHAIVNAIDPHTFVVDFGQATEGLDQSALLQYEPQSANLTGTYDAFLPSVQVTTLDHPFTIYNIPVSPTNPTLTAEALSSYFTPPTNGDTAVAPIDFPSTTDVENTQTVSAPYTEPVATNSFINSTPQTFVTAEPVVNANGTLSSTQFDVTFNGYVNGGAGDSGEPDSGVTIDAPMVVTSVVGADPSTAPLTSTTVGGVAVGETPFNPSLNYPVTFANSAAGAATAGQQTLTFTTTGMPSNDSLNGTFQLQVGTIGTGAIDFDGVDLGQTATNIRDAINQALTAAGSPLSVTNVSPPTSTAEPYSFNVTFSAAAPVVQFVTEPSVKILKQTGSEFEVNPPLPTSIYTQNTQELNSTQPAVAIDGSGDFVITWTEQVSQDVAPKDITDIYFRRYSPIGLTGSYDDTGVIPGEVTSDLAQQQELTFDFTDVPGGVPTSNADTFQLQVGSATYPVVFNTDPLVTAANIQAVLEADYPSVIVTPDASSSSTVFSFDVTFEQGTVAPSIQIQGTLPATVKFTNSVTAAAATQQLTFDAASLPVSGLFELQVGSVTTGPIYFDSTDPDTTDVNIEEALDSLNLSIPASAVVSPVTTVNPFIFNVAFSNGTATAEPAIQLVTTGLLPAATVVTVAPTQAFTGVRLLTSPSQELLLEPATGNGAVSGSGTFQLQLGSLTTPAINFNSTSQPAMAAAIQTDLQNLGFKGATVSVDAASTTAAIRLDIGYANNASDDDLPAITFEASPALQATVTGSMYYPTGDPYTQLANVSYTNPQFDPAVAMDDTGDIVIVWANQGQDVSWFNNISMARFDKDGNQVGYVSSVDDGALTNLDFAPDVAIGYDGNVAITWSETQDPTYLTNEVPATVFVRAFNAQSSPLWNEIDVDGGGDSTVSMDGQDNIVLSWTIAANDPDLDGYSSAGVYAKEYELESYVKGTGTAATGVALAAPTVLRNTFRVNSASTNTASQVTWPFNQDASDVQMDIDGDILATYEGNGPAASDNISIPAEYFDSYFSTTQVQQLTFDFTAGVPASNTDTFELSFAPSGGTTTAITFNRSATITAGNIRTVLAAATGVSAADIAVSGVESGDVYDFTVTFTDIATEISNATLTAATDLGPVTFTATTTKGVLNTDLLTYFDPLTMSSTSPAIGALSPYSSIEGPLYQEFLGGATAIVSNGYTNGVPNSITGVADAANENVDTAIDQVLYAAQAAGAGPDQLGRLDAILNDVAGLLRGESNGILMSQFDADPQDTVAGQIATYSDDIVSTQRGGQDQRAYLVVPYDVEQGTFQISMQITDPTDELTEDLTTNVINMPSSAPGGEPEGNINDLQTMKNIAAALDAELGTIWPGEGSVNIREVASTAVPTEITDRAATAGDTINFSVPTYVTDAEDPTTNTGVQKEPAGGLPVAVPPPVPPKTTPPAFTPNPDGYYIGNRSYFVFELVFQGQAANLPIALQITNANDTDWVAVPTVTTTTTTTGSGATAVTTTVDTTTYADTQEAASPPQIFPGDYEGTQGPEEYNASVSMTSAGSMVVSYTNQAQLTDGGDPGDAFGNATDQNIYAEPLEETTDTAGPHVVGFTDSNGVDLLKGGNATGVSSQYLVLTFDEPMLSGNPTTTPDSVYNAANYQIYNSNGTLMSTAITNVSYGLSEVAQMASTTPGFATNIDSFIPDNKWEVVLSLGTAGLADGTYTVDVLNAEPATTTSAGQSGLCNTYGTALGLTGWSPNGAAFTDTITISSSENPGQAPTAPGLTATDTPINTTRGGLQLDPAVATSAGGNYVVVWTSSNVVNGATVTNIEGQLYKASGTTIGTEFVVNDTASSSWGSPDVSMAANGSFVVTWSGAGPGSNTTSDTSDVFARQYSPYGQAIGNQFEVDQWVSGMQQPGVQNQARVAVAPDGTFVITWTGTPIYTNLSNTQSVNSAIFAREYSSTDSPVDTTSNPDGNEIQITAPASYASTLPDVAMDAQDNFVIVWSGDSQSSSTWGVYEAYFTASGLTAGAPPTNWSESGPTLVDSGNTRSSFATLTTITDLHDTGPRVAMDNAGAYVVTWANYANNSYEVYAQQFSPGGGAAGGSFMVNTPQSQTGAGWQVMPAVGMVGQGSDEGAFTVAWTSYGQDNAEVGDPGIRDYGIYCRMYNANGTPLSVAPTEFRVNATTLGNQVAPAVTQNDPDNDAIIVWVGPDTKTAGTTAIYLRNIDPPGATMAAAAVVPSFTITSPTSGSFNSGQIVTIQWTASNVNLDSSICLAYDTTTNWGNPKYIEIDAVTAADGTGAYSWNTSGIAAGTYYLAGYLYDGDQAYLSHTTTAITMTAPTFTLTGPGSGTYAAGQTVTFQWTAANVDAGTTISLAYDTTTNWGNPKWIEVDSAAATAGAGSYTWNTTGVTAGTYYLAAYMYDNGKAYLSHLTSAITITAPPAPSFTLTGSTSGSVTAGQTVTFQWTAANIDAGSKISLAYDTTTNWGNPKWIEIDGVAAADGAGSYGWNTTGVAPGTYYLAGYVYDGGKGYLSHLTSAITIGVAATPAPSFTLTGPTSGTFVPGQTVTFQWTAANIDAGSKISLAYDTTTNWGNPKWIEIDGVAAVDGAGSYVWNTSGVAAGTYYLAGYVYDDGLGYLSHLSSPITIAVTPSFTLTGTTSGSYTAGATATITWNAANVPSGSLISLAYDTTSTWGNPKWIEIDGVSAASGSGSYNWNTTGLAAGTYYIEGYMYTPTSGTAVISIVKTSFTVIG